MLPHQGSYVQSSFSLWSVCRYGSPMSSPFSLHALGSSTAPSYRVVMVAVYLFTYAPDSSPVKTALEYGPFQLSVYPVVQGRLVCPLAAPPQLTVLEPGPQAPPGPLLSTMRQHPVVGRSRALIVVDDAWMALTPGLPITDFVARSASPVELMARTQRILNSQADHSKQTLRSGKLLIDVDGFEASVNNVQLSLTPQEFALLKHLVSHSGRVQSRDKLLDHVWGRRYAGGSRTVDIHVRRLRAKLGPQSSERLQTIRGVGYKWSD